jgi:hypothetical protein
MDKFIRFLSTLDWFVAVGTTIVGLYLKNWWIVASGVLGLAIAYYQPAMRVKGLVEKKFLRKMKPGELATTQVQHDEAFYAQVLGAKQVAEAPIADTPPRPPRTYASPALPYSGTFVGRRKHNMLKAEHFNMYTGRDGATHY